MTEGTQLHIGLSVPTAGEFKRWLKRLKDFDVPHRVVDGERVYFEDPDGLLLELEIASPMEFHADAAKTLARWVKDRV